jgi:hypothetical protein
MKNEGYRNEKNTGGHSVTRRHCNGENVNSSTHFDGHDAMISASSLVFQAPMPVQY